ncbi:hypothetical protein C8J57DRAFT_1537708 [Mycena rebaudengoi]|nr:hypothetical protein C8J57DRAFT_1537708 [Mycena rebaudengoi]
MSKRHPDRARRNKDDPTYDTKLPKEERAQRHREAVQRHYKKNDTTIREKRRLQMAQKKAEKKLRRRRWDPPKKIKRVDSPVLSDNGDRSGPAGSVDSLSSAAPAMALERDLCSDAHTPISSSSFNGGIHDTELASEVDAVAGTVSSQHSRTFAQIAAPDTVSQNSRTSAEIIATNALMALHQFNPPSGPGAESVDVQGADGSLDSVFEMALLLSSDGDSSAVLGVHKHDHVHPSSRVQAGQIRIAELSSGPVTAPTEEDAAAWALSREYGSGPGDFGPLEDYERLPMRMQEAVLDWTMRVYKARIHLAWSDSE